MSRELAVHRWQPTPFAGRGANMDLEARRRHAHDEGHRAGYAAGLAAAQQTGARLAQLLEASANGLGLLEQRVAGQLLDVALEVARHVVRGEVAARREALLPVVREALGLLSQDARAVEILAHPSDAELLRAQLSDELARSGWRIADDHRIEPGGARIVSSAGDIDATLATRWRRVLAALGQDHAWRSEGGEEGETDAHRA